jgi:arylsulfatase A-like enzyme
VLLVSLDTLRADHLVPYGYARPTSPALSRFAAQAIRFDQAHAHSTATLPSHLSLFTSLLPPQIGITREGGPDTSQASTRLRLSDRVATLAERLRDAGYRTAAFTDGGFVIPYYGFDRGFDHFAVTTAAEGAYRNGFRKGIARLVDWLEAQPDDGRPFFVFLHTYDVHEPYSPPPPFERSFSDLSYREFTEARGFPARPAELSKRRGELGEADVRRARGFYDNGVLATDRALGRLFAILRKRGIYDQSLVVVLSDHGEEFLDHGDFGHGPRVYQELARVPLLLRLPGGAHGGTVVRQPVGLVDVAPTLLDLVGLEPPEGLAGRSLRGLIEGTDDGGWLLERPIYVDVPDVTKGVAGLRRGRWKLVRHPAGDELYDLEEDPGETTDLAGSFPDRVRELGTQLDAWVARMRETAAAEGTLAVPADAPYPGDRERALRALGYLE